MTAHLPESLRLFYALWPDDETRAALAALQYPLEGRKTAYSDLHLTLAFLGQQPASLLPVLEEVLTYLPPLSATLHINRLDYFNRNRIAWAGMCETPVTLLTLHEELIHALAQHEITCDRQTTHFKPHITLARDAAPPPDIVFDTITWRADRIALVQSMNSAGGTSYRVLNERSLNRRCRSSNAAAGESRSTW